MDLENKSDVEIPTIADPIMDNLMEASTAIDHARHVQDFTDRLKAIVTKDYLERVCRQYQTEKGHVRCADVGCSLPPARLHRDCVEASTCRLSRRLCCKMVRVQQGAATKSITYSSSNLPIPFARTTHIVCSDHICLSCRTLKN